MVTALTWPDADPERSDFNLGADLYRADIQQVGECRPGDVIPDSDVECTLIQISLNDGPDAGQLFELPPFYDSRTEFASGETLVVARIDGVDVPFRYGFSDRERRGSLVALAAVFAVAVVLLGRLRGFAALLGLCASFAVIGFYTLPALLAGQNALVTACVTSALIAFLSLYLSHGFTSMTTVALLGTLSALALTVLLGAAFISLAAFSGFASEESFYIAGAGNIDVRGLLLAGLVIGALGALDDMTVTQSSVVFEMRANNPTLSRWKLFASAMRVGRDHVASTVNTLFLAYAGASLPLLLLFSIGQLPVGDVANSEIVAIEIVRTLVGSIGLVASVPLTTWLAVQVVRHPEEVPAVIESGAGRPTVRRTTTATAATPELTSTQPLASTSAASASVSEPVLEPNEAAPAATTGEQSSDPADQPSAPEAIDPAPETTADAGESVSSEFSELWADEPELDAAPDLPPEPKRKGSWFNSLRSGIDED